MRRNQEAWPLSRIDSDARCDPDFIDDPGHAGGPLHQYYGRAFRNPAAAAERALGAQAKGGQHCASRLETFRSKKLFLGGVACAAGPEAGDGLGGSHLVLLWLLGLFVAAHLTFGHFNLHDAGTAPAIGKANAAPNR
ncbi:hypothetical protein D9M72_610100 [compost metagenome]